MGIDSDNCKKDRFAFVIPVYNHDQKVRDVVKAALKFNIPVFVVNDGSTDDSLNNIKDIKEITLLHHDINQGKGAALQTGFCEAAKVADWAITVDADGQHNVDDAVELIKKASNPDRPIVIGKREGMDNKQIPWTSRFGRKFSNFWVFVSGGPWLQDSQSGFRIYPLPEIMQLNPRARRYQFEVEILAKAGWQTIPVVEVPISVDYMIGSQRVSHFRPFVDFLRNFTTFTRLIFQRFVFPRFIRKKLLF